MSFSRKVGFVVEIANLRTRRSNLKSQWFRKRLLFSRFLVKKRKHIGPNVDPTFIIIEVICLLIHLFINFRLET